MNLAERVGRVATSAQELRAGRPLVEKIAASSGWSAPMAAWIVEATLAPLCDEEILCDWARAGRAHAGLADGEDYEGRTVIVAGGCVPDPGVRATIAAYLLGGDVTVKVARAEPVLLPELVAALGPEIELLPPGEDRGGLARALGVADRVLAFGRSGSLDAQRDMSPPRALFMAHGPAMSFAVVLDPGDQESLRALAHDVARYDQRGCLSVQAAVVCGGRDELLATQEGLAAALADLAVELPPGSATLDAGSAFRQRLDEVRLDAIARGDGAPVATDGRTFLVHPSRRESIELSPGRRIVSLVACAERERTGLERRLPGLLGRAASHVQGIAISGGDPAEWQGLAGASRVARAGELQLPPLTFRPDGHDPFELPGAAAGHTDPG